jgi:hypothetical protein
MLPAYILPHHNPPPARLLLLTVNSQGRLYPSKALLGRLGLRAGQAIDLLPPGPECSSWQLDLRPTAPRRIKWYTDTRPRVDGVRLPAGLLLPGTSLTLALVPTELTGPGLYQLRVALATDLT